MTKTDNHDYNVPERGAEDWDVPLNENFEWLDVDLELRTASDARDDFDPKVIPFGPNQTSRRSKHVALDTGEVSFGFDGEWTPTFSFPRIEGGSSVAPNLVSGSDANSAGGNGVSGATVSGGFQNDVTATTTTIGGGQLNVAEGQAATVAGGEGNTASEPRSTVSGGKQNTAEGSFSAVGGGAKNEALARGATIAGGGDDSKAAPRNVVYHEFGTIGGGDGNQAGADGPAAVGATVGGGLDNTASGARATVAGGFDNTASKALSTVGGGWDNTASGLRATVSGGRSNTANGDKSTVGGGFDNTASGDLATVGGGVRNAVTKSSGTVGGGNDNAADGKQATIGGGFGNDAGGEGATVAGGDRNDANGKNATVGGGHSNDAEGDYSAVPGGADNLALGAYSVAAGHRARTDHDGTFVWADSSNSALNATGKDQFLIEASGGVGIGSRQPEAALHVADSKSPFDSTPDVAIVENTNSEQNQQILTLKSGGSGVPPDAVGGLVRSHTAGSTDFIRFETADTFVGQIALNQNGKLRFEGLGADYAEYLPKRTPSEVIEPGDLVGIFGGKLSRKTADADKAMVVSDQAIVLGNAPMEDDEATDYEAVAFIGQVPTKVHGPVRSGDVIVPSGDEDGTGAAVPPAEWDPDEHGPVVGQAWESDESEGVSRVTVAVGLDRLDAMVGQLRTARGRTEALEARVEEQAAELEALREETARLEKLEARLEAVEATAGPAMADGGEPIEEEPP